MKNKGFSLVELIIVIAIMAILVGLMAPQLIKYIEKTNVSSDEQLLDSVYQALRYAIVDSEVQADDASRAIIGSWDGTGYYTLDSLEGSGTVLEESMEESLGWSGLDASHYLPAMRSAHTASSQIRFQCDGFEIKGMWITNTDKKGKKDTSHSPSTFEDAAGVVISVPTSK